MEYREYTQEIALDRLFYLFFIGFFWEITGVCLEFVFTKLFTLIIFSGVFFKFLIFVRVLA